MGLDLDFSEGQTPLDEDERDGLLIRTITTSGELNEFEQLGVEKAVEWSRRRQFNLEQILSEQFVKDLHRVMFGDIWKWAGEFRRTNKNIGIDKNVIRVELRKLLDDSSYWASNNVFDPDEIAVRFSHRIVSIHPFANGNGRHSRLIADILISHGFGRPPFTWGSVGLIS
ncbi:MAG TPA: mobile mystery protein B, partial [Candidatus Kryptobacter bacterium]|nr:mobile mystery protein B [Candidatus Kryptobacter bacterium]